jgi:hypothetical protein
MPTGIGEARGDGIGGAGTNVADRLAVIRAPRPMLPNKPRSIPRVDDRGILNESFEQRMQSLEKAEV